MPSETKIERIYISHLCLSFCPAPPNSSSRSSSDYFSHFPRIHGQKKDRNPTHYCPCSLPSSFLSPLNHSPLPSARKEQIRHLSKGAIHHCVFSSLSSFSRERTASSKRLMSSAFFAPLTLQSSSSTISREALVSTSMAQTMSSPS